MRAALAVALLALGMGFNLTGCSSAGIALKERFGYAKREQLVDKVEATRNSQEAAKKQFESALQEFIAVTGADTGDLEAKYKKLNSEYNSAESRAETVRERIKETERVASALFKEWKNELDQYSDPNLRRTSEQQLDETQDRYRELMSAMQAAANRMDPVLGRFKDQVLFLKHNLNARAVAGLRQNVSEIQTDVERLIREMEASIAEADRFIKEMGSTPS
jgi:chromosome segregation ATPase